MKLAIFGASGRTGRHLIEQALAAGHEVTALVRDPARLALQHERLSVIQGDVQNAMQVEKAIAGSEAVLLALGHTKTSSKEVLTVATRHVLEAMRKHNVRRLVNLTGAGVADPLDEPKLFNKFMGFLLKTLARDLLADSERQVQLIRQSDRDWVIVRVPRLTDQPRKGKIRVGYAGKGPGPMITRADTADFMLKQVTDNSYLRQAPMISN